MNSPQYHSLLAFSYSLDREANSKCVKSSWHDSRVDLSLKSGGELQMKSNEMFQVISADIVYHTTFLDWFWHFVL